MTFDHPLLIAASYVLGAIPFGLLIVRQFYHVDIRKYGSGNTGATNVWRTYGKIPGITTLTLDIIKGALPVFTAQLFFPQELGTAILCGMMAIIGHNWSIFLKGKGGKGVATSIGVFIALMPLNSIIAVIGFLLFFLITKHVSVGSIAGAVTLLVSTFIIKTSWPIRIVVVIAALMVLIKHIPNIKRLIHGEEPKVNF